MKMLRRIKVAVFAICLAGISSYGCAVRTRPAATAHERETVQDRDNDKKIKTRPSNEKSKEDQKPLPMPPPVSY